MASFIQPPRLRIGEEDSEEERRATWLELFYDLVFVVAVAQLSHYLKDHVSVEGALGFIALFIPVWWSWIGNTLYANRFDTDDVIRRLLTGLQMLAAAAIAVNIHHGLGESSPGLAISYAAGRFVLVMEYYRAGKHIPTARPLTTRYAIGFAIGATIWAVSAFVPIPWRFVLWAVGIIVDFVTPFTAIKFQLGLLPNASHLPERFGLFTMIVLGEAIVAVVDGVSKQDWEIKSVLAAVFGLCAAFSLWWVYFDNLGGKPIIQARQEGKTSTVFIWLYTHLPLVIGIAATGVGVQKVLTSDQMTALPDKYRWLLCASLSLCWAAIAILHRLGVIRYCKMRFKYRFTAAVVILLIGFLGTNLSPAAVIGLVATVCVFQVFQDMSGQRPTTRLNDSGI
jgi:low temperature requirement protein LtrA